MLGFYLAIIAYSDFGKFTENISQFKFEYLLLVLFLNSIVLVVKGFRQQIILQNLGINIPIKDSILLYLAGLSMLITPGGSGQIIKSYFLKNRFGIQISKSIPLVLIERFADLIAITFIVTLVLILIQNFELLLLIPIIWVIIILIYTSFRNKTVYKKIESFLIKFSFFRKQVKGISESYDRLQLATAKGMILKNWVLSVVAWSIDAIAVYFVFVGFNQDLELLYTTFVMYTSLLLGFITFLPAGLGVTELSFLGLLTTEGIQASLATSVIIMIRLTSIWYSTIIGLITSKMFLKEKNP